MTNDLDCLDLYALTIAAPRRAGDFAERAERQLADEVLQAFRPRST